MTPNFSSLVDFIAVALDLFEERNRKKVFSELKTFSAKQTYFRDIFDKIELELVLSEPEMKQISQSLIKVENILSHIRSIPLYTDTSSSTVDDLFFNQFTMPFIKQFCSINSTQTDSTFFCKLDKFLFSESECNGARDIISLLKSEILTEIRDVDVSSAKELKLRLAKLDERSFPSRASIKKYIDLFHQNILIIENKDKADSASSKVYMVFFAAKVAFFFAKFMEKRHPNKIEIDSTIEKSFLSFNKEYTFNVKVSSEDDSYINDVEFKKCKRYFLKKINQEDPVSFLKENGTRALWRYKNGVFISYAIREQLLWDINKGRFNESGINHFIKNSIPQLSKRQTGTDGVDIAIILMGMKILLSKNIVNNSLEPLINFLIDNLEKHNLVNLIASTPFGKYIPSNLTASQINIALAVRTFNESLSNRVLNVDFCNPLSPLDEMLKIYFDKGSLTKKQIEKKPIKTEKATAYDALKNINYYILSFGLQEEIELSREGCIDVLTSKSGCGVNTYLSLPNTEKISILKLISSEECSIDLSTP
ncbi:hypothetical protein [Photobacterium phosphoreum]|uniref:hypothetical protein n=1 Tax=Photobacterium phosphoreum TaxID=659 RepID=UPI000D187261|nr:hypothetical protein [Photobacterium phosphoreum]MCD9481582.1 hypothetical protein [Photobacterium phosphoreum]PSU31830.1 hypothetical protein CTM85_20345 [Photobacterium phosphoreum]